MGKSTYVVAVIRKDRNRDYRDFWDRNIKKNLEGEELHPSLVGFTEIVEALNLKEAITKVQKMHPGLTIARDCSHKLG